ncbi:MAG: alpha/beta hydrolase [Polaromonas sp.]
MTWILLRGLTRESRHWDDFVPQLAQCTGEEVLTLDLPGNGEFANQTSPASVRGMLAFARRQLQARSLPPPYRLLAMSLGGMVAADWAQRYPLETERLVLINTSMRPFSTMTQRLRPANWLPLARLAARWRDNRRADKVERTLHRLTCNQTLSREHDLAAWLHIRQSAPVSATSAILQLWAAARFSCAASPPPCPVLVLSSGADHLVNPLCSMHLAAAWQTAHQQHPWAGHDLPHDDADWVCRQVAAWLGAGPP